LEKGKKVLDKIYSVGKSISLKMRLSEISLRKDRIYSLYILDYKKCERQRRRVSQTKQKPKLKAIKVGKKKA
jgi:hypothetical protein